MPLIMPPEIDDHVRAFAASIRSDVEPVFIPVKSVFGSVEQHCFGSVMQHVAREGGSLVTGWAIWTHPNVYIEAEHHGVWMTPDGDLIDITPKPDGEKTILFLPDDSATLKGNVSRNSIRKSLVNDLTVIAMIKAADKFYPYHAKGSRGDYADAKTIKSANRALDAKNRAVEAFNNKYPS